MSTTILQASVGAGKTEAALHALLNTLHHTQAAFPKVWVLLATRRQEHDFRRRLVELLPEQSVFFNTEFFNFYELNVRLLNLAGQPPRRINESARTGVLRVVIDDLLAEGELQVYQHIARTPGFIRLIADFIYELKQNRVDPEDYWRVAISAHSRPKDRDLALIYGRYQALLLDHHLVDREGEGWLALLALRDNPRLISDVDLLLVDGYDQFTPVQAELLARCSQQVGRVLVTLTSLPEREKTIGLRFQRAFDALQVAHNKLNLSLDTAPVPDPPGRDIDLYTLGANIFRYDLQPAVPQSNAIHLLEAPDAAQETAAMLRRIKRLLLDGTRPDDMLVAVRDWERYQPYFEVYSRLYDLPILLHYSMTLSDVPVIAILLKLLGLHEHFRRADVLDVLRSPYIHLAEFTSEDIDLLERISLQMRVIGGRESWLNAIKQAAGDNPQGEDIDDDVTAPLITSQQESDLSTALENFFDLITPADEDTLHRYVTWLEQLIGRDNPEDDDPEYDVQDDFTHLYIMQQIRALETEGDLDYLVSRDIEAMQGFKRILRGFLQTEALLQTLFKHGEKPVLWEEFYRDLLTAIGTSNAPERNPGRTARILVTTASNARGLPHPHVFIPGLSEGIFPVPLSDDLLYLDGERRALYQAGIQLRLPEEKADDDGLFYELISLPRRSLTLSRPTVKEGKEWNPSHLWRMTQDVFEKDTLSLQTLKAGQITPPHEVATSDEAMLAVMHQWRDRQPDSDIRELAAWLTEERPADWQRIQQGYGIESGRINQDVPPDSYSGMIRDDELLAAIMPSLDDRQRWSATRLNNYGSCGYRFFANYILKLEALTEPEAGIDVLQRGQIYHEALEATYKIIKDDDLWITPDNEPVALEILVEMARDVFAAAPAKLGFKNTVLWRREQDMMLKRLQALVKQDFAPDFELNQAGVPRKPWALEFKFGFNKTPQLQIPIGHGVGSIFVRGAIDRIDKRGNELIVIDYKSGTTKIPTSQMKIGRNFQMMIYLLALHQYLQNKGWHSWKVANGFFWHIRNGDRSGKLALEVAPTAHEAIQLAQVHVADYILRARQGDFVVHPPQLEDGRCSKYCDFYQLCRISNTSFHPPVTDTEKLSP